VFALVARNAAGLSAWLCHTAPAGSLRFWARRPHHRTRQFEV